MTPTVNAIRSQLGVAQSRFGICQCKLRLLVWPAAKIHGHSHESIRWGTTWVWPTSWSAYGTESEVTSSINTSPCSK